MGINASPAAASTIDLMRIDRLYTRSALATTCGASLAEAAAAMLETMRAHGVRRLVVTAAVLKGDIRHDSAGLGEVRV